MLGALRVLAHSPGDIEARTDAAFGALVSGIALANSGLGAAHGFASGMGGMFDIPHGLICAIFLAPVLRANSSVIRDQISDLVSSSGLSFSGDAFDWLLGEIEGLIGAFGLEEEFSSYDVPRAKITEIAERSIGSSMAGNPVELSLEQREEILREVLS
jgi:alcohol dehydrogenase class IV